MKTKAIIIKKAAANEHDQIISCYTEEFGSLRALARSIFKPTSIQSLHLDNLNLVEFELVQGRALPIITGAQVIDQFSNVKGSLSRLAAVQFFCEVLDKISFENEKDTQLWQLLHNLLVSFNQAKDETLFNEFRNYQAQFLKVLGYAPQIQKCVICADNVTSGPERMVALSAELGGAMCGQCFMAGGQGVMFDKNDLAVLTGQSNSNEIRYSAVDTFFEYTIGQKLVSLAFLYSVLK